MYGPMAIRAKHRKIVVHVERNCLAVFQRGQRLEVMCVNHQLRNVAVHGLGVRIASLADRTLRLFHLPRVRGVPLNLAMLTINLGLFERLNPGFVPCN